MELTHEQKELAIRLGITEEQAIQEIEFCNQKRQEELNLKSLQTEVNSLSQDLIQVQAGAVIDNIEEKRARFRVVHNEIRTLLGKEPRIYSNKTEINQLEAE